MPSGFDSLHQHLLFGTCRIESKVGPGYRTGTGFIMDYIVKDVGIAQILVTNRHVVEGAESIAFGFTRARGDTPDKGPALGEEVEVTLDDGDAGWQYPDDSSVDLAILHFGFIAVELRRGGDRPYIRPVSDPLWPTAQDIEDCDVGDPVVMVGYPSGLRDEVNLLPLFRRGYAATLPWLDLDGSPNCMIDMHVFPGSSGSPVYIYPSRPGASDYRRRKQRKVVFLGILHSGPQFPVDVYGPIGPNGEFLVTGQQALSTMGLGVVLKAPVIRDFVKESLSRGILVPPDQSDT